MNKLDLPEVNAFEKEHPNYVLHLDESIGFLEQKMNELEARIEKIEQNPYALAPCNPWMLHCMQAPEEAVDELCQQLGIVSERYSDFVGLASEFIYVTPFYMPLPSGEATVLFQRPKGLLVPARLDIFSNIIHFCEDGMLPETAEELYSSEGAEKMVSAFPEP